MIPPRSTRQSGTWADAPPHLGRSKRGSPQFIVPNRPHAAHPFGFQGVPTPPLSTCCHRPTTSGRWLHGAGMAHPSEKFNTLKAPLGTPPLTTLRRVAGIASRLAALVVFFTAVAASCSVLTLERDHQRVGLSNATPKIASASERPSGVATTSVGPGPATALPPEVGPSSGDGIPTSDPAPATASTIEVPSARPVVVEAGQSNEVGDLSVPIQTGATGAQPADPWSVAVSRLPGSLSTLLPRVSVSFGCHPTEGCHYGVWDFYTDTIWLSPQLLDDPSLLADVLTHELAHVADTLVLTDSQRNAVYATSPDHLDPREAMADCVTLLAGGSWTFYWTCDHPDARQVIRAVFQL